MHVRGQMVTIRSTATYRWRVFHGSIDTRTGKENLGEAYDGSTSLHACGGGQRRDGCDGRPLRRRQGALGGRRLSARVDYEKYPDEHCLHVRELLEPEGVSEEDIRAIISHGYGITTEEVKPETDMEKSLFAVDELTGIVQAYALMRPEGLDGMAVKSLKKKFKDKRFAAKCSREIIKQGFAMLGMEAGEVMQCCIDGMQAHKEELGF